MEFPINLTSQMNWGWGWWIALAALILVPAMLVGYGVWTNSKYGEDNSPQRVLKRQGAVIALVMWVVAVAGVGMIAIANSADQYTTARWELKTSLESRVKYMYNLDEVVIKGDNWDTMEPTDVEYKKIDGETEKGTIRKETRVKDDGTEIVLFFLQDNKGTDLKANYLLYDEALQRVKDAEEAEPDMEFDLRITQQPGEQ